MELNTIIHGDALDVLRGITDNSIDSIVTDPPYGISFMSKGWDTFTGNKQYAEWVEQWSRECLRILKPGGHVLAFSGTRTYHALAWGVESAGFEIRDMIEWLYLSGFPKSMDVGKQFDKQAGAKREVVGYSNNGVGNTASSTYVQNKHESRQHGGTGVGYLDGNGKKFAITAPSTPLAQQWDGWGTALKPAHEPIVMARKPLSGTVCANVEQYNTGAINVDGCRIGDEEVVTQGGDKFKGDGIYSKYATCTPSTHTGRFPANCITIDEEEWYSKYFGIGGNEVVANVTPQDISKKASKRDRGEGNSHPTVKPIPLMAWLIRLVTPPNGITLDPFAGSGSTLVAAKQEGFSYIGIERESEYVSIAHKRLS